jgi:acetyl esterase/lipase
LIGNFLIKFSNKRLLQKEITMRRIISFVYGLLILMLASLWTSSAQAVTEAECAAAGFGNVVAPYRHSQPLYDGTHHIDLYLPNTTSAAPLIVYLHGGGWGGSNWPFTCYTDGYGSPTGTGVWLLNRLSEGFAIASIEYTPATTVPPTAGGTADNVLRQVREIKYAIRWLKSKKTEYTLDAAKVVITGGSAGGHLAALTALTDGESLYNPSVPASLNGISSAVQFVFAYAGIYNIASYTDPLSKVPEVFGCWRPSINSWRPCSTQTLQQASPVNHITANDPKVYLLQGDLDTTVPPQQSNEFSSALCAANKLSYYNLTVSGGGAVYQHNLEPALAGNPFMGAILNAGLNNTITSNCH